MRRKLAVLLTLCVAAVSANYPAGINTVRAGEVQEAEIARVSEDDFIYREWENGNLELMEYTGSGAEVVIPSVVDGKEVTIIGNAFSGCSNVISIKIPDSVTSIGEGAFSNCSKLTSIEIPNSVTSIGGSAFLGCSKLTSIEIPNSVMSIEGKAFAGCSSLTNIKIPDGVTSISDWTFSMCKSLTSIEIPNSVTSIGDYAFDRSGLISIEIPNGITSIGYKSFCGCSGLMSIEIPGSVENIGTSAFLSCSSLTSIKIPDGVTIIGDYAFNGCSNLTSIEIPKSVMSIGEEVFLDTGWLENQRTSNPLVVVNGILIDGRIVSGDVKIPDGVTSIGDAAFSGCSSVTSIEIPDSVTSIGEDAFYGCSSLASVGIPESVSSIGKYAFSDCWAGLCIYYEEGSYAETYASENGFVKKIRREQTITALDFIKTVGDAPFSLAAWTDGDGILSYTSSNEAVASVSSDGTITVLSQGVAMITIAASATENYAAAQKVITITVNPASGTGETPAPPADLVGTSYDIGSDTYTITSVEPKEACFTSLNDEECTTAAIPSIVRINGIEYEVSSIAERACYGMETLQRVSIGENLKEIGAGAFAGCAALEQVKIPESVQSIGGGAFAGCAALEQVEIPESVQSIGEDAFAGCSDGFCMICARGSAAEAYAAENGIRHKASADEKELQTITAGDFKKTFGDGPFSIEAATDGDGALSYESDNESVAAVSAKGTVILMGTGTARITIRASGTENYEPAEKTITITVNPKPGEGQNPGTGSNNQQNPGNKKAQTITADDIIKTYGDKAFPIAAGSDGGTLSYTVKNPAVAAIDGNGTVTLKGCGRTEIVITAAAYGEYMAAEKTITLTVVPKKLKGISAKSTKAGTLTVKWKKDTAASGYIIECSTDRKFRKNVKTITVKKNKTTSKKMTKLKSGKKYYVRACAYAQAGGAKIKGAYTAGKKAVKVKK